MPSQTSIHARSTLLEVRRALLQGDSGGLMAGIELPKSIPNCDLKTSTQPMARAVTVPEAPPGLPGVNSKAHYKTFIKNIQMVEDEIRPMTAPEAPPGLPLPGLHAPGFSQAPGLVFNANAEVFVPQRSTDVEATPPPVGSRVMIWRSSMTDALRCGTITTVETNRRIERFFFIIGNQSLSGGIVVESYPDYVVILLMMQQGKHWDGEPIAYIKVLQSGFMILEVLPMALPTSTAARFKMPALRLKNRRVPNVMKAPPQGFEGDSDKQSGNDGDHQEPNQEESKEGKMTSADGEIYEGQWKDGKRNGQGEGKEGSRTEGKVDKEANMQDASGSSNVMTASQGFKVDSDKLGGNEGDHQEQPNEEEGTQGSNAGEANAGSRTLGTIEPASEEANMQGVSRSSDVMTAPSQGFEGDSDELAGDGGDHQEPSHEESTYGFDAGECNEGSRTEEQTDENEIGAGQVRPHGQKRGYRQRQQAKKFWMQVRQPSPER